ncbi:MAG: AAA family ATPase [Bacteroidales bacterium]|nr:AAA family ATPase [Bacteroidales bacterium]
MSNYTLTYDKSKSQEIYIEDCKSNKNPYFKDEYEKANVLINEIVRFQNDEKNKTTIKQYGCNNRILFIGQRGCGKTSVMRSLAKHLSSEEYQTTDSKVPKVKFCCLPIVDPSHFNNNDNILLTVITNMFSEAKMRMSGADTFGRENLLSQFEKVFKSLSSINLELSSHTLETLNRKSDAEDLSDKIKQLVDEYLKLTGYGKDNSKLVLLIDDLDMSVSYAPDMLEQLRKYLEIDNLIVLISANLGQLANEMREKYSSAFKNTLKDSNQALSIDVEDLATKYLLKLFPTSRRINVERHVSQLLETDLKVVNANDTCPKNSDGCSGSYNLNARINITTKCFCGKWDESEAKGDDSNGNDSKGDFQKKILSLIWEKTRLLFIPKDPDNTLHPIIPTNLRDLVQFLDMLTDLEDVKPKDGNSKGGNLFEDLESYNSCEKNLKKFKNYVMNIWIPNHLSVEEELVFKNIPTDITEINKHLINSINVIGTRHKNRLMSRQVDLSMIERNAENINIDRDIYTMVSPNDPKFVKANKISDIFNQPSNYSYGDLLLMIDKYETYFESGEDRKFTDAIKIYYSILLFETMFFKSKNVEYEFSDSTDNNGIKKEYPIIPIQRLIGGNVYYPNYFEIITDKNFNQKGPSFDAKRAFYHKVKVNNNNINGKDYPLFAVLYYGDIRPDRYEKEHIYDTTFSKNAEVDGANYVTFDILSILNNMLNPCHTLNRFDVNLEDRKEIIDEIRKWGFYNKIENGESGEKQEEIHIPNAILPFYSVDMMLSYLSKSYQTSEVVNTSSKEEQSQDKKAKVDPKVLNEMSKKMFSLNGLSKEFCGISFYIDKCLTILDKLTFPNKTGKKTKKSHINNGNYSDAKINNNDVTNPNDNNTLLQEYNHNLEILEKFNDCKNTIFNDAISDLNNNVDDEHAKEVLKKNLQIIQASYYKYKKIAVSMEYKDCPDDIQAIYRNYVIALIMENYEGSKKDRNNLIKDLHKFTTVSEIYKHLVETLWDNAIMELLIRAEIQQEVRKPDSVAKYYNLLWNETEKMLDYITVKDKDNKPVIDINSIYKELCNMAGQAFINGSFSLT